MIRFIIYTLQYVCVTIRFWLFLKTFFNQWKEETKTRYSYFLLLKVCSAYIQKIKLVIL